MLQFSISETMFGMFCGKIGSICKKRKKRKKEEREGRREEGREKERKTKYNLIKTNFLNIQKHYFLFLFVCFTKSLAKTYVFFKTAFSQL